MDKLDEKIKQIEEELKRTERNKATEHHIGFLLAKLAKLKKEKEQREQRKAGSKVGFAIKKQGDATAFLIGFPSVGKSTLINKLTGTKSKVAAYEFTTLEAIPGILKHRGFEIQLIDAPGIIKGASWGKGRGKEVISALRAADLLIIVLEPDNIKEKLDIIKEELYNAGIRINEKKPDIKIEKTDRGGINITKKSSISISEEVIKKILMEFNYHNANITLNEDITVERLIDAIAGNRFYVKAIFIVNKSDKLSNKQQEEIKKVIKEPLIFLSAERGTNIEELKDKITENIGLIKIYTMDKFGKIDHERPLVLKENSTVADACKKIHRDLLKNFNYAKIWGKSAKFNGQKVGLEHILMDGDVIFIKTK
ncbi:MAG: GTP-binding protein [Candidatus Anstonellales archaeon]